MDLKDIQSRLTSQQFNTTPLLSRSLARSYLIAASQDVDTGRKARYRFNELDKFRDVTNMRADGFTGLRVEGTFDLREDIYEDEILRFAQDLTFDKSLEIVKALHLRPVFWSEAKAIDAYYQAKSVAASLFNRRDSDKIPQSLQGTVRDALCEIWCVGGITSERWKRQGRRWLLSKQTQVRQESTDGLG